MKVIEGLIREINKRRWERWRARQNKEREKSYFYCTPPPGACGECNAIAGVGRPPETAMAAVTFSGELIGDVFHGRVEGEAVGTAEASALVTVTATKGLVIPYCKRGRNCTCNWCCYLFWGHWTIYDEFTVINTKKGACYTCILRVGRGFDIDEDSCTICC